jgi:hypothetical protein
MYDYLYTGVPNCRYTVNIQVDNITCRYTYRRYTGLTSCTQVCLTVGIQSVYRWTILPADIFTVDILRPVQQKRVLAIVCMRLLLKYGEHCRSEASAREQSRVLALLNRGLVYDYLYTGVPNRRYTVSIFTCRYTYCRYTGVIGQH